MKPYPVGHELKLLVNRFESIANRSLAPLGITTSQAQLLIILNNSTDTMMPQKKLEAEVGASQATVNGLISRLAAKELVSLRRDEEDHRINLVAMTLKGIECSEKAFEILRASEKEAFSGLDPEEISLLERLSATANSNISHAVQRI